MFSINKKINILNDSNVEHALWRLELANDIAIKYPSIEASVLTMHQGEKDGEYEIILYTNTTSSIEAQLIKQEDIYWDILKDEFGKTCLRYLGDRKNNIKWKDFNKAVWSSARNKHPEWKIKYVSIDKSGIVF